MTYGRECPKDHGSRKDTGSQSGQRGFWGAEGQLSLRCQTRMGRKSSQMEDKEETEVIWDRVGPNVSHRECEVVLRPRQRRSRTVEHWVVCVEEGFDNHGIWKHPSVLWEGKEGGSPVERDHEV